MSGIPSPSPVRIYSGDRDKDSMWYFSTEDLANSPSRRYGISPDQELSYRQMTAYLIQEMGQRLQVSQLCINTAIVYMHRFYAFHSFTHFHRNGIAAASLFLAAKVEEQPRKLEHVIKAANKCLSQPTTSTTDSYYIEQAQDLVFNENVLLQTLGFDVAIDHPHTHVVKTCHLVKACKDLAQTSYFLASNSLHLTSMCLQYKPTVVACFCIYLACKWSRWEIPQSTEGKHWFHYVDETVTMELLKKLTDEFIAIYEKSPARLKSKLNSIKALAQGASNRQGQVKEKKGDQEWKVSDMMKMYQPADNPPISGNNSQSSSSLYGGPSANEQPQGQNMPTNMLPPPPHQPQPQMRKSEMHSSSQHRTHHSSSSSSSSSSTSHHPPKMGYSSGDVSDHKSGGSHKQQPPYGTNLVNRPRDHSSSNHSQGMMVQSSKSSSTNSSRSSLSNSLPGQPLARQASQGHSMDVGYHKSRDRNIPPPPTAHNMPQHVLSHKMGQKQDPNRTLLKDHSSRISSEQPPKQSSSNSKMFSSSSSTAQYGSNQQISSGGVGLPNSKPDGIHDMSRNLMHPSRGYNQAPPPPSSSQQQQQTTNGPANNLLNFHQPQQQGTRSSNNNNNITNSSNIKLEQSKISVHMQQATHSSTHHHKQLPPPDASFPGLSTTQHDLQQQQQQQQQQLLQQHSHATSQMGNNYCKIEPMQHSDDQSMSQFTNQSQNTAIKTGSMFSPDWNQESQQQQLQQQQPTKPHQLASSLSYNNNGNMSQNFNSDTYSAYKMSGAKETSPKIKTERDTSSKKEKNRSSSQQDSSYNSTGRTLSTVPNQPALKTSLLIKIDQLAGLNELAGTSNTVGSGVGGLGVGGLKRTNDQIAIKLEDDSNVRDNKIRKLDNSVDSSKHHQVINGIETNPDLVRNLLKESLCQPSALLKTENSIITPSLQPPAELLEPSATTSIQNTSQNTSITSTLAANVLSGNSDASAMEIDDQVTSASGSKSEKKKKKDKHKHKEKDKGKSKDREERKKHKKDKDRHKDKEGGEPDNTEHVKIKISKEKLEAAGEPIGFKIKIPKERIMGDLCLLPSSSHAISETATVQAPPPALKIKISKDKLESYSSGAATNAASSNAYGHSNQSSAYAPYGSAHTSSSTAHTSSSSSSKKKDRDREKDRERDKDKKRSHDSSSKSNGGSGMGSSSSGAAVATPTNGSVARAHSSSSSATGSTTQKCNKINHQSNMSLLFGESNESTDDDDDDF